MNKIYMYQRVQIGMQLHYGHYLFGHLVFIGKWIKNLQASTI